MDMYKKDINQWFQSQGRKTGKSGNSCGSVKHKISTVIVHTVNNRIQVFLTKTHPNIRK